MRPLYHHHPQFCVTLSPTIFPMILRLTGVFKTNYSLSFFLLSLSPPPPHPPPPIPWLPKSGWVFFSYIVFRLLCYSYLNLPLAVLHHGKTGGWGERCWNENNQTLRVVEYCRVQDNHNYYMSTIYPGDVDEHFVELAEIKITRRWEWLNIVVCRTTITITCRPSTLATWTNTSLSWTTLAPRARSTQDTAWLW